MKLLCAPLIRLMGHGQEGDDVCFSADMLRNKSIQYWGREAGKTDTKDKGFSVPVLEFSCY